MAAQSIVTQIHLVGRYLEMCNFGLVEAAKMNMVASAASCWVDSSGVLKKW